MGRSHGCFLKENCTKKSSKNVTISALKPMGLGMFRVSSTGNTHMRSPKPPREINSLYLKPSHRSGWSNLSPSQPQKLDVSIWKKQLFADALEAEGRRKANSGRFIVLYIMNKVEITKINSCCVNLSRQLINTEYS